MHEDSQLALTLHINTTFLPSLFIDMFLTVPPSVPLVAHPKYLCVYILDYTTMDISILIYSDDLVPYPPGGGYK